MNNTYHFHLEENVGVQHEAKATVDFEKPSNKDEMVSIIVDEPQSPTEQNQAPTKNNAKFVRKKKYWQVTTPLTPQNDDKQ